MSEKRHASVFIKVGFYLFDVGSDWVTGGIMLSESQLSEFVNLSTNDITLNSTITNDTIALCLKGTERHLAWGIMTIAMSWIPATVTMFALIAAAIQGGFEKSYNPSITVYPLAITGACLYVSCTDNYAKKCK